MWFPQKCTTDAAIRSSFDIQGENWGSFKFIRPNVYLFIELFVIEQDCGENITERIDISV